MNGAFTIWKKEILDSIRDRRTLITAVLMPVFLMPVIMIGSLKFAEYQSKQIQEKPAKIAISNEAAAPTLVSYLQQQQIEILHSDNFRTDIDKGSINVFIEVPASFEQDVRSQIPSQVKVYQKSSNLDSSAANSKIIATLQQFNQYMSVTRLAEQGINPEALSAVIPSPEDIATSQEKSGFFLGLLLPMFIVIFAIVGGMYIAIDVSAGEKERKTLEALLLTPASRLKIVTGKFLAVASTASTTIVLSLASMYVAFKVVPLDFGTGELTVNLTIGGVAIMLGIGIFLAIMFSGLLLSVAIFAKSYKEAQNYISPFYLVAVLPVAILGQLPGFKPVAAFFLIPGVNAVFVIKEILLGVYNTNHILVTFASLIVYAAISIFVASKIYSKEGILFRD
ncbi:MAG: ABC transporter permease [Patescibacteria group bacterium]|jgi:sodium transport system permease protein